MTHMTLSEEPNSKQADALATSHRRHAQPKPSPAPVLYPVAQCDQRLSQSGRIPVGLALAADQAGETDLVRVRGGSEYSAYIG